VCAGCSSLLNLPPPPRAVPTDSVLLFRALFLLVQVRLDRLLCRFGKRKDDGRPRWAAQSISLLGNKPILKEGTQEPYMWDKHPEDHLGNRNPDKPVKTLPLFPSDHFGVVLKICAPDVTPSRWRTETMDEEEGDDDSDTDNDDTHADDESDKSDGEGGRRRWIDI
jgi:hypothetical protein